MSQISECDLRRSPLYSEQLGIELGKRTDREYFKWFLASLLFGGRISETIAGNTYRAFARHRLLTPRTILDAGWDTLVHTIMREGGYVRYDDRKADPEPLPIVRERARELGVDLDAYKRKSITFARVEAGLIRARRRGRTQ